MKRSHWVIVLPLVLLGVAQANSIYTVTAPRTTYVFSGMEGGDNALFSLLGPNIDLSGGGTASCAAVWCIGAPLAPGSTLVPNLTVDFESSSGTVSLGGHVYSGFDIVLYFSSIKGQSFMFPAGGNVPFTFTVVVPAKFSLVSALVTQFPGQHFYVQIPQGKLVLTFNYVPSSANGRPAFYSFSEGQYVVTTPEPGTISLIAIGMASVIGVGSRRKIPYRTVARNRDGRLIRW